MNILRQSHPKLESMIRETDEHVGRQVVERSVRNALGLRWVSDELQSYAHAVLRDTDPSQFASTLQHLSERFDQEYFQLRDEGEPEPVWSQRFHDARFAYALCLVANGVRRETIADILYELAHSTENPTEFLDDVQLHFRRVDK